MEQFQNIPKKNIAIGLLIFSVLSFFGFKYYQSQNDLIEDNKKTENNQARITSRDLDQHIQKEFSKILKLFAYESQKTAKKMSEFNRDFLLKSDYLNFRNQLFTKDIEKQIILVESKNISHSNSHDTSNYIVYFEGENNSNNSTSGFGVFKNVIGFRLLKATIPSIPYHITENNNKIYIRYNSTNYSFELTNGNYTNTTLKSELETKLNSNVANVFSVSFNDNGNLKYTITASSGTFRFNFTKNNTNSSYNIFGFLNYSEESLLPSESSVKVSDYIPDLSVHYVDLVVPEIPYMACKKNSFGKNVIDRIPITAEAGSLIHYNTNDTEYFTQNYFYPLSLDRITIELYEDSSNKFYNSQNMNNYFEFEITTIKNTDKLNVPSK